MGKQRLHAELRTLGKALALPRGLLTDDEWALKITAELQRRLNSGEPMLPPFKKD
jgi:hypothetical protein